MKVGDKVVFWLNGSEYNPDCLVDGFEYKVKRTIDNQLCVMHSMYPMDMFRATDTPAIPLSPLDQLRQDKAYVRQIKHRVVNTPQFGSPARIHAAASNVYHIADNLIEHLDNLIKEYENSGSDKV